MLGAALLPSWLLASPAGAVSIELKDVAADRVERQLKAIEGNLPLAGTPDLARFDERLAKHGLQLGAAVFMRIFKSESELEVWMEKDGRFVHFATYPICHWSGTLGPKVREGDKQAPEGFYTITRRQLHLAGRWPRSLNLGFPNVFDKSLSRTGNYILIHGGCSSVGCYAMTNTVIDEIFRLSTGALAAGQTYIPVHVFPFRMTVRNMAAHKDSEWAGFWANLKEGYDAFERTTVPPRISVCEGKYQVRTSTPAEVGDLGPLGWCGATAAALRNLDRWYQAAALRPSTSQNRERSGRISHGRAFLADLKLRFPHLSDVPSPERMRAVTVADSGEYEKAVPGRGIALAKLAREVRVRSTQSSCSLLRASCRKHTAMLAGIAERRHSDRVAASRKRALRSEAALKDARNNRKTRTATRR